MIRKRHSKATVASAVVLLAGCRLRYEQVDSIDVDNLLGGTSGTAASGGHVTSGGLGGGGTSSGGATAGGAGGTSNGGAGSVGGTSQTGLGGTMQAGGWTSVGGGTQQSGAGAVLPLGGSGTTGGSNGISGGAAGTSVGGSTGPGGSAGTSGAMDPSCQAAGGRYTRCPNASTYAEATKTCEVMGLRLIRLDSTSENSWYAALLTNGWIGANDIAVEGEWRWSDGQIFWRGDKNGSAVGGAYTAWSGNDPSGNPAAADCARLDSGGRIWVDVFCDDLQPFACEAY